MNCKGEDSDDQRTVIAPKSEGLKLRILVGLSRRGSPVNISMGVAACKRLSQGILPETLDPLKRKRAAILKRYTPARMAFESPFEGYCFAYNGKEKATRTYKGSHSRP